MKVGLLYWSRISTSADLSQVKWGFFTLQFSLLTCFCNERWKKALDTRLLVKKKTCFHGL